MLLESKQFHRVQIYRYLVQITSIWWCVLIMFSVHCENNNYLYRYLTIFIDLIKIYLFLTSTYSRLHLYASGIIDELLSCPNNNILTLNSCYRNILYYTSLPPKKSKQLMSTIEIWENLIWRIVFIRDQILKLSDQKYQYQHIFLNIRPTLAPLFSLSLSLYTRARVQHFKFIYLLL